MFVPVSRVPDTRRRTPRQRRSKATRDAILEAASRVFTEVGLERATTARIAEVAGVSPGSLYQYFPSKQVLVTALFERETDDQIRGFLELAAEAGVDDVPKLVREHVARAVAIFESKRSLYTVLLDEVPRVSGLRPTQAIDHRVAKQLRLLLELGRARIAPRDLDTAAMLLVRAFRYTLMPIIYEPFEDDRREAFIDELSDMLLAYLLAPRTWRE